MDEGVKVIKRVKALSNDPLKPRHHVIYVITSEEPKIIKVKYVRGYEMGK
ncbi:hypothetical protein [Vulcanisaeta sp. JCM 14467]